MGAWVTRPAHSSPHALDNVVRRSWRWRWFAWVRVNSSGRADRQGSTRPIRPPCPGRRLRGAIASRLRVQELKDGAAPVAPLDAGRSAPQLQCFKLKFAGAMLPTPHGRADRFPVPPGELAPDNEMRALMECGSR